VAIGPAAERAGRGLLLAMGAAGAVALMNGISSSQLGINFPVSGGTYAFARQVGQPFLGFVAGSASVGKEVIGLSVIALTFATYSAQVMPGLPIHLVGAGAMLGVTVINVFGLEVTTKLLIALTVVKVGALLAFAGLSIPEIEPAQLMPAGEVGFLGLVGGAAVFFFAFAGYSRIATIAEEVEEPETVIPRGIIVGFLIAAAIFLLVGAATLGVLGPEETGQSAAPVHAQHFAPSVPGAAGSWLRRPGWRR
jgi:basic amino acid/polyamine antiporter, APA family